RPVNEAPSFIAGFGLGSCGQALREWVHIRESRRYDELSALVDEAFARRNSFALDFAHRQAIVEGRFFTFAITEHTARVRRDDYLAGLIDVTPAPVIPQDRAGDLHVSQSVIELLSPWERWLDDYVSIWIDVTPASIPLESRESC